ncbi:hypothetical protein RIF29_42195 [Crotalaria pallida]|uniref:GOLD domain-containing protein n=1 Tax=Crotalaria pallida TaxID=3830 RepID=A0AAN9E6X2_CROPI
MGNNTATTLLLSLLFCFLCLFFSINLVPSALAIWLTLPSSGTKCVSEEIQSNVVVLADYIVIPNRNDDFGSPTIALKVTSPYGNDLHHKENTTYGNFAFTSQEAGSYMACFRADGHNQGGEEITLNLDWKIGIAAKDWDSVARKEKIEGVELELRKLEGVADAIHKNMLYLKHREEGVRTVSEKTNSRVAWFGIMSLGICITVSALQVWRLKRFFRNKKLI